MKNLAKYKAFKSLKAQGYVIYEGEVISEVIEQLEPKKTVFTHKVISIQTWNNNKEQLLSQHKTLQAAENAKIRYEKHQNFSRSQNLYRVDEIK